MAQLRDIRRRITSITKTQQVTRAMKMIAAVKLRRAQAAVLSSRPYTIKLHDMISGILHSEDLPAHPLLSQPRGDTLHILVITGEKGLCGGFNSNVFREVESIITNYKHDIELTVFGKKGVDYFRRRNYNLIDGITDYAKKPILKLSDTISENLVNRFVSGQCHKVAITYTEFQSALSQKVVTEWLLPLDFSTSTKEDIQLNYIYHPNAETILKQLLPKYIRSQIFRAILESSASEYGARMTAMDNATRNSVEMISKLTLQYNQARQSAITTELIEIVSGAEALKG